MAERLGPDFRTVVRQSWALTLYCWYRLQERDAIARKLRDIDRVDEANLTAIAFNEPKKLADERQAALDRAREAPDGSAAKAERERAFVEQANRLIAAIEGGKVLEGDTVTHA